MVDDLIERAPDEASATLELEPAAEAPDFFASFNLLVITGEEVVEMVNEPESLAYGV